MRHGITTLSLLSSRDNIAIPQSTRTSHVEQARANLALGWNEAQIAIDETTPWPACGLARASVNVAHPLRRA